MGKSKWAVWLEDWLKSGFNLKKLCQIGVLAILLGGAIFWYGNTPRPVAPVLLLINHYPLTEKDKTFLKKANPYGFLLGIPARTNMNPCALRKELEDVLQRKDFVFFIDQEGGLVNRIKYFDSSFKAPAPAYFGKLAQKDMPAAKQKVYEYGLQTGKKLKELSIDVAFAPLAEAAAGADTYTRSRYFSDDPTIAKKLADLYAQGLADGGVTPCYKHFLGVASSTDPHETAQQVSLTLPEIRARLLPSFAQANKWPFLMTAHALYPALDKKNVSAYSPAYYRLARQELAFEGIIITDALNMEAASGAVSEGVAWRMNRALQAGADVVIPFFNVDANEEWMQEQIAYISKKYARRLKRKIQTLKKQGKYIPLNNAH